MKILILSDSHGVTKLMETVVAKHAAHVACVMFLGDYESDCKKIAGRFQNLTFHIVPGNCDFYSGLPRELTLEMGGKRFWLTHGDRFGVKSGYGRIRSAAVDKGANICLFGHTHAPIVFEENGILFLNPGSISQPRGDLGKSYAVVDIVGGAVLAKLIEAK